MELGMIGLGRMGANMAQRLLIGGHRVAVYDISADAVEASRGHGAVAASSLSGLLQRTHRSAGRMDNGSGGGRDRVHHR